jgi:hypothetical protein
MCGNRIEESATIAQSPFFRLSKSAVDAQEAVGSTAYWALNIG